MKYNLTNVNLLPIGTTSIPGVFLDSNLLEQLRQLGCATEELHIYGDTMYAYLDQETYVQITITFS